jgi:hypothetical protein
MKLKKMQKMYCPDCANRIRCELGGKVKDGWREETMQQQIKWYGTGSMDSENKLWSLRKKIDDSDFGCAVIAEIMKIRFLKKAENLYNQVERLELDRKRLLAQVEKCESIIPKQKEVVTA